jgi:hypothetical protein
MTPILGVHFQHIPETILTQNHTCNYMCHATDVSDTKHVFGSTTSILHPHTRIVMSIQGCDEGLALSPTINIHNFLKRIISSSQPLFRLRTHLYV